MLSARFYNNSKWKILNTVPNRTHNLQISNWKTPENDPVNVVVSYNNCKQLFNSVSKFFKQIYSGNQESKPYLKENHVLIRRPPLPVATNRKFYSQMTCNWSVHSISSKLESPTEIICKVLKSKHFHNQFRTFQPISRTKIDTGSNMSLIERIKAFFGIDSVSSETLTNLGKELQRFQSNLDKENLSPEMKQKLLLSFVEGYSFALESSLQPKSSWGPFITVCVFFSLLIGLFKLLKTATEFSTLTLTMVHSNIKFDDVKGVEEAKQELKNIVEFLKTPQKFSALGGKLPKGVLLVGPPGTGKTLLAKAVAGEAGVPFFYCSGSEFDEVYVGVGAKRVRELFRTAKENTPCVIFIDEIDSIGKQRTSSTIHPHANDTINQLLTEMDGFKNSAGVIVLGATNRKKDLDKALLRPGRFDVEVTVPVPDYRGRKELLEFYLGKVLHQNVDIEKLARGTTNFTGADIQNLVNQAAVRAAGAGAEYVTTEHLEYARDKTLMGPESLSRVTDEDTNRITAYHEGGHALVAHYTQQALPLHKVTIIARGESLGHTAYIPDRDIHHVTRSQMLASLDVALAGRAAEEVVFGPNSVTSGASADLEKATQMATKMVRMWGMSDAVGLTTHSDILTSPEMANLIDKEIKALLQESYERAKSILIEHKDKHKQLSETLLKEETLDAAQVAAILKES